MKSKYLILSTLLLTGCHWIPKPGEMPVDGTFTSYDYKTLVDEYNLHHDENDGGHLLYNDSEILSENSLKCIYTMDYTYLASRCNEEHCYYGWMNIWETVYVTNESKSLYKINFGKRFDIEDFDIDKVHLDRDSYPQFKVIYDNEKIMPLLTIKFDDKVENDVVEYYLEKELELFYKLLPF